ncbi:hypothetical protein ACQEVC_45680 [Plantactinospora sp. CA-294935]|uniref:hypothetical protein n=1 Tax=Plantactinospora sp. CA-294935 TaxID=3240012 RepID=UPI003D8F8A6F
MPSYLLGILGLLLAFTAGFGLARHLGTGRIEAMHAAMTATRPGPHRWAVADSHRAGWRAAPWRWIHDHLPHRRAAA